MRCSNTAAGINMVHLTSLEAPCGCGVQEVDEKAFAVYFHPHLQAAGVRLPDSNLGVLQT